MTRPEPTTFDDVLALMLEDGEIVPSYESLEIWSKRYPAFTDELADFFASLAFQAEEDGDAPSLDVEHFANLAVSEALNRLHSLEATANSASPLRLSQMAHNAGLSDADVASRVGIDDEMFMKLDRGRIVPVEGIPRLLARSFAAVLAVAIDEIWMALALPKMASSRPGLLKSRKKAQLATETFEEALSRSSLSDTDKATWRRAIAEGTGPP
ncbi:MAG: hypothetical protein BGO82_05580 [Devosia sp. 67-54]|uniref:hypothetical protein n=1 Tax=unclassified Devosia TaxID=196773 RepID=UPI0009592761|nr:MULTISPECIES: hypothetical protein [unclassified Devosia]MBN9306914.1 hypothetical protein [Devosia sp.]OJX16990.1 MAG: hypothetical protein BGO82_05580 [Devosia sp. 67-54]